MQGWAAGKCQCTEVSAKIMICTNALASGAIWEAAFAAWKIQLILYRRWESRWTEAVMLAHSRWPGADGWRGRGWRVSLLLWPLGGISWEVMGGPPHAGQAKGPSNREINFWRWSKAGAQKCGRARQASSAPSELPAGPSHVSCATRRFGAVPSKVPAKVLKAGSETGQIHSLDGVRRAAGCLVMNYICNHNDHIAAKNIQIEIMKSLGRENKNRASSFLSKTCPFSCLKLYWINGFCSIPGRCSHTPCRLMLKEYNGLHC